MRTAAFYLPQYHPIPENDAWWGKGFTEWRNVAPCRPRYPGHHQPHLPADLGFYDLRLPEVMHEQARLAQDHGIDAFCAYHYWFNGRQLLERPMNQLLERPDVPFPFLLCWANENWTRRWDGKDREVLMGQDYAAYDARAHLRHLAAFFADPRYEREDGEPVFVVYDPTAIPEFDRVVDVWRDEASRLGVGGLHVLTIARGGPDEARWLANGTVQGIIDFVPTKVHPPRGRSLAFLTYAVRLLARREAAVVPHVTRGRLSYSKVVSYRRLVERSLATELADGHVPCVMPSWDNSPRRVQDATIIQNLDPGLFEAWVADALRRSRRRYGERGRIFVNAWNEWAEGCHLEPDTRTGRAFLEAVRSARAAVEGTPP